MQVSSRPSPHQTSADLQVLLFQVGGSMFGIPVAQLRYIATLPPDFRFRGTSVDQHFVFEGEPLAYVALWDRFGLDSEYAEYQEMQEMLPKRLQDHLDWMAALEDSIRVGAPFTKARNPRECAFGKWFYAYQAKDQSLALLLGQFERPHARIHALAEQLLRLVEQGASEAALAAFHEAEHTTLATVKRLFAAAEALVVKLQRRIAIIVADGELACALGVDAVRDIVSVPAERLRLHSRDAPDNHNNMMSGLILLDDQRVVPLLNWQKFCVESAR